METSLACMLVALCYMLPEAEFYIQQLELPCPSLLERTNHVEMFIAGETSGLLGMVRTTNYVFSFHEEGHLGGIGRVGQRGHGQSIVAWHEQLAREGTKVEPRMAHQVATQWLAAVGIDVVALDQRYRHRVDYPKLDRRVPSLGPDGELVHTRLVPYYWVTWGQGQYMPYGSRLTSALALEFLGTTKEVVSFSVEDPTLVQRPRLRIPGQAILRRLPNEPFAALWTNRLASVTNVFGILRTSTAYQSAMLERMLAEANWALCGIGLRPENELTAGDLTESFVTPPRFGFQGCLRGKDAYFEFDAEGKLRYIFHVLPRPPGLSLKDYYVQRSREPSLVDSNSVVTLATIWLKSLDVDLERLLQETVPTVSRHSIEKDRKRIWTHIWWVQFVERSGIQSIPISVEVNGVTRQANRVRFYDAAWVRRPGIAIPNADELMAVPDPVPQRDPLMPHCNVARK